MFAGLNLLFKAYGYAHDLRIDPNVQIDWQSIGTA